MILLLLLNYLLWHAEGHVRAWLDQLELGHESLLAYPPTEEAVPSADKLSCGNRPDNGSKYQGFYGG